MRKLSGKTINSLALCVALAAPLVYLFGTLFMTLAGSHGEQMIAELNEEAPYGTGSVYFNQLVPDNQAKKNTRYNQYDAIVNLNAQLDYVTVGDKLLVKFTGEVNPSTAQVYFNVINQQANFSLNSIVTVNELSYTSPTLTITLLSPASGVYLKGTLNIFNLTTMYGFGNEPTYEEFESVWTKYSYPYTSGKWVTLGSENPIKYSDYLFGQFFASDNFLAESGREVLNGTPLYGFEPIGELVRYTDENMLHLANLSYGPLVIGYTYYCAHVIIVDLIFYIGSFIPRLIKKTINKLEGGLD